MEKLAAFEPDESACASEQSFGNAGRFENASIPDMSFPLVANNGIAS
jgi:hypothetical protein